MSKNNIVYDWDEEAGIASCTILTKDNLSFTGSAYCDKADFDMKSEKTGMTIALMRARIKYYKHLRDNKLRPELKALVRVEHTMEFLQADAKSISIVRKEIQQLNFDLAAISELIAMERENLKEFLADKEKFYKRIRYRRNH